MQTKDKYEQDAISINSLHASASLLQGRDLDKVSFAFTFGGSPPLTSAEPPQATMKLDKAQQTVVLNERDYRQYAGALKESTQ